MNHLRFTFIPASGPTLNLSSIKALLRVQMKYIRKDIKRYQRKFKINIKRIVALVDVYKDKNAEDSLVLCVNLTYAGEFSCGISAGHPEHWRIDGLKKDEIGAFLEKLQQKFRESVPIDIARTFEVYNHLGKNYRYEKLSRQLIATLRA